MKIGLDIDNVISAFDKIIMEGFIREDKKKRNRGIINPNGEWIAGCFDWTQEEVDEFFVLYMEDIAKVMEVREGAREYMTRLMEDGHELYLVTHRVYPVYKNPYEVTSEWLAANQIPYTRLVMSKSTNKTPECKQCEVDIMFDDSPENCRNLRDGGIRSCCMATDYSLGGKDGLDVVNNWEELYEMICQLNEK